MIKRLFLSIVFVFCTIFLAHGTVKAEVIRNFEAKYQIQSDGTMVVTENIAYDFEDNEKHGIFRTIPIIKTNQSGDRFKLDLRNFTVIDQSGEGYAWNLTNNSDTVELKIGDANTYVSGLKNYIISYVVSGGLSYFSDHDELYWNVTGNDWQIPIESASAMIEFPGEIASENLQLACFTGQTGSTESNCLTSSNQNNASVTASSRVSAGEGFTIVAGFPKGIVAVLEPEPVISIFDNPLVVLAIILGAFVWYTALPVWIVVRWWRQGRDPKPTIGQAHVWFAVPKISSNRELTPAEMALLLTESVSPKAITGTVVNLAHKGLITVEQTEKKLILHKKSDTTTDLQPHEKTIFDAIFADGDSVNVSTLTLATTYQKLKSSLPEQAVKDKLFVKNPYLQQTLYLTLAMFGLMTGNVLLLLSSAIFGYRMPRKTQQGANLAAMSKALKEFLTSQDDQYAFQAKQVLLFEKMLPYATALGIEKIWAERFAKLNVPPPEWYSGNSTFSTLVLANAFSHSFKSMERGMTPTNSSSGFSSGFSGGSSGGGGGGGGGGSW